MTVEDKVQTVDIRVLNIPTKIFTIGEDVYSNPEELILIIPGTGLLFKFIIEL